LYGFSQAGFMVQLSPTLEELADIEIPDNLDHPLLAAKSLAQILGTLATVAVGGGEGFVNEVFPVAFYLSYIDIVGALGYGFQWKENWMFGANLKVINRRFSVDRVNVEDYDVVLSKAWENIKSDVTGVTCDIGGVYNSSFGTSFGVSLQNLLPIQEIKQSIDTDFREPQIMYDRENGNYVTNAEGDTALVSAHRNITVNRPFVLKTPFIASVGVSHPLTPDWDVAVDWVDIAEQDSRYRSTTERIRMGTEYRLKFWKDNYIASFRTGFADEHFSVGLGLNISRYFQIDGAYAYDRFVKAYSYFGQIQFGF